jgi:hypothetical protein
MMRNIPRAGVVAASGGNADRGEMIGIAAIMRDTTSRFKELRVLRRHLAVRPATTGAESKNSYHDGTRLRFARDSPLEESGFEPLVPPRERGGSSATWLSVVACRAVAHSCDSLLEGSGFELLVPLRRWMVRKATRIRGMHRFQHRPAIMPTFLDVELTNLLPGELIVEGGE